MSKLTTSAIAAALLIGASSLAMAQGLGTSPSTGTSPSPSIGTSPSPSTRSAAPMTGSSSALSGSSTATMDEAMVKQKLQAAGYSDVKDVHQDKDGWSAKATRNGKQVSVNLDNTGKIETR